MDAVYNDSALLLLTYDDTKSLRVRIKTLSKKYVPPAELASPMNTSDEIIGEQFGKIRPHSNLLDAILIPEAPSDLVIPKAVLTQESVEGANATDESTNESGIDAIQIDYSTNVVLCSSSTNLNDILRETNQKYDKKLLKNMRKSSKKHNYQASARRELEDDEDCDPDGKNSSAQSSHSSEDEKSEIHEKQAPSFVKRLRNSVREMFTRSASKEYSK